MPAAVAALDLAFGAPIRLVSRILRRRADTIPDPRDDAGTACGSLAAPAD